MPSEGIINKLQHLAYCVLGSSISARMIVRIASLH